MSADQHATGIAKLEYIAYGDGNFRQLDSDDAKALLARVRELEAERDDALIDETYAWEQCHNAEDDVVRLREALAAIADSSPTDASPGRWFEHTPYEWARKVARAALAGAEGAPE